MNALAYIIDKYGVPNRFDPHRDISPHEIKGFHRRDLAELFKVFGYKTGVEIGIRRGDYSELICNTVPKIKMFGVDPYEPYIMDSKGKIASRHISEIRHERYFKIARERLKQFNYTFIRKYSIDAVNDFDDESIDFVYIDANHDYDFIMQDLIVWGRKVRVGGIISGHDYLRAYKRHIINAVKSYTYAHYVRDWFLTQERKNGKKTRDRSFFWIK